MMLLPFYIPAVFLLTNILALYIFYLASGKNTLIFYAISVWLLIQAVLAKSGFYQVANTGISRFLILILPPVVCIVAIFSNAKTRIYTDRLDLKWLTLMHVLRIPVEIILYLLFVHRTVPRVMTFDGRNLDILAGLTAPLIYYFGLVKFRLPFKLILFWNLICLVLLLNIVVIAILSMPLPIQQFGFSQPNIALFYFPYVWLPSFLVPLVMFAHLVAIRQLLIRKSVVS